MNKLVFANDAPSAAQIEPLLQWLTGSPAIQTWALVDVALLEGSQFAEFIKRREGRSYNTLAASTLSAFGEHAPQLLELPGEAAALSRQVQRIFRLVGSATAVSWLRSEAPVASLQNLFGYLAKVQVEERSSPIHCRFADTRVLPELLHVLTPAQQARVASQVQGWGWMQREGRFVAWSDNGAHGDGVEFDACGWLRLSAAQFRAMQQAAEADGMFLMLCDKTPELVPTAGPGAFHGRLRRSLETASALQVKAAKDRLEFVVLSLSCGEDFHRLPALQPTWQAIAERQESLFKLMQSWDDALWAQLESRKGVLHA